MKIAALYLAKRYATIWGKRIQRGVGDVKYLFLHGLGQTSSSWEQVLRALNCGKDIYCPELFDFLQDGPCSYAALYKTFSAYCGGIDDPVCLCGLSLGGILAMQYAVEHPEKVQALVLIGTQYVMPKKLLRVQNAVFQLMPNRTFVGMGLSKQEFVALSKSMMELDFRQDLHSIACPVLVVCGERDRANKKAALELQMLLPQAELRILKGAGHEVNVEAPEALGAALNDFFQVSG